MQPGRRRCSPIAGLAPLAPAGPATTGILAPWPCALRVPSSASGTRRSIRRMRPNGRVRCVNRAPAWV